MSYLPRDVWMHIGGYLPHPRDEMRLALTCTSMYALLGRAARRRWTILRCLRRWRRSLYSRPFPHAKAANGFVSLYRPSNHFYAKLLRPFRVPKAIARTMRRDYDFLYERFRIDPNRGRLNFYPHGMVALRMLQSVGLADRFRTNITGFYYGIAATRFDQFWAEASRSLWNCVTVSSNKPL